MDINKCEACEHEHKKGEGCATCQCMGNKCKTCTHEHEKGNACGVCTCKG